MGRLSPWLSVILLLCGPQQGSIVRSSNGMLNTPRNLSSNQDGLQCSDCTQLDNLSCTVHLNDSCAGLGDSRTDDGILGVPNHVAAKRYYRINHTTHGDTMETGINVTFKFPYGFGTGMLTGFEIQLIRGDNWRVCHRMNFSQANFTGSRLEQDMTLFFDCLFPYTDPYAVIVTTLPNYKKGSSVVLQPTDVKNAPVNPNLKMTADRWSTTVKLAQVSSLCELEITYDQSEQFEYYQYQVKAFWINSGRLVIDDRVDKQNGTLKVVHHVNVSHLVHRYPVFTARVRPLGRYINGMNSPMSNQVNLTGCFSVPPAEPKPIPAHPEPNPDHNHPRISLSQQQLWLLTAGVIVMVTMAACLVGCLRQQKETMCPTMFSTGQVQPIRSCHWNGDDVRLNSEPGIMNSIVTSFGDPYKEFKKIRSLTQVLVLFWFDNADHMEVVHSLCMYLKHQCACSIAVSLWTRDASEEWLSHQIKNANCVLIINSEGAFKNYRYIMETNQNLETDLNQHSKTFLAGIEHLRINDMYKASTQSTTHKSFMVCFPYTSCDHLLPEVKNNLCCYHLMQDISKLFLDIHGIPEYMPGIHTYGENINEIDYKNCREGMELWHAIENVKGEDTDSGYSEINPIYEDRGLLVPTHDSPPPRGRTTDNNLSSGGDDISVSSFLSHSSCYSIEDEMAKNNKIFLK